MTGYASTADMLMATSLPVSTGLGGALGAIADSGFGTDEEMTEENETPRDGSGWANLLFKGLEAVPTIVTNTAKGYDTYEASGGGGAGVRAAVIDIFGKPQKNLSPQEEVNLALQQAKKSAPAATPAWYTKPPVLIGGVALFGLAAWFWRR